MVQSLWCLIQKDGELRKYFWSSGQKEDPKDLWMGSYRCLSICYLRSYWKAKLIWYLLHTAMQACFFFLIEKSGFLRQLSFKIRQATEQSTALGWTGIWACLGSEAGLCGSMMSVCMDFVPIVWSMQLCGEMSVGFASLSKGALHQSRNGLDGHWVLGRSPWGQFQIWSSPYNLSVMFA